MRSILQVLVSGALIGTLGSAVGFVVGTVMGIFILLFLLTDWARIIDWTGHHVGLPSPVGARMVDNAVHAFRAYARADQHPLAVRSTARQVDTLRLEMRSSRTRQGMSPSTLSRCRARASSSPCWGGIRTIHRPRRAAYRGGLAQDPFEDAG